MCGSFCRNCGAALEGGGSEQNWNENIIIVSRVENNNNNIISWPPYCNLSLSPI